MSMQSGLYRKYLPDLVRSGEVPQAKLDDSVRRVLALKAMLGLFDDPFRRIDEKRETRALDASQDPRARARSGAQVDRDAQERGRPAAPAPLGQEDRLDRAVRRGPARSRRPVGRLWRRRQGGRSCDRRSRARSPTRRRSSSRKVRASRSRSPAGSNRPSPRRARPTSSSSRSANAPDMSGEAQSRTEIVVPEPQQQLAEAVAAAGKPIVVVLKHGRALALEGAVAERAGDPRHLVPRHRDRQCHRRRAVRRLRPVGPPPRELSARSRARSPIITRTSRPAGPTRRASCSLQGAFPRHPEQRALPVRPRPHLRQDRLFGPRAQRADAADEREIEVCRDGHQPRHPRRRGSRAALHPRPRRERHPAGARAEGVPQDRAGAGSVGSRCASRSARPTSPSTDRTTSPMVEPGTFDVWIAPSAESRRRPRVRFDADAPTRSGAGSAAPERVQHHRDA